MNLLATYFGSSTWLIDLNGFKILTDPWLSGDLVFNPPGSWLIKGRLQRKFDIPDKINLLLLTQGLADHCHIPSLKLLDKSICAIVSPSASKILEQLDYIITPHASAEIDPKALEINKTDLSFSGRVLVEQSEKDALSDLDSPIPIIPPQQSVIPAERTL